MIIRVKAHPRITGSPSRWQVTGPACLATSRVEGPRGHQLETPHPCQRAARPGTRMQETDHVQMTLMICRGVLPDRT